MSRFAYGAIGAWDVPLYMPNGVSTPLPGRSNQSGKARRRLSDCQPERRLRVRVRCALGGMVPEPSHGFRAAVQEARGNRTVRGGMTAAGLVVSGAKCRGTNT